MMTLMVACRRCIQTMVVELGALSVSRSLLLAHLSMRLHRGVCYRRKEKTSLLALQSRMSPCWGVP